MQDRETVGEVLTRGQPARIDALLRQRLAIAVEELARVCASTALSFAAHTSLVVMPIYLFGNETQKKKALYLRMPSDSYAVEVRDEKGNIRYAEQFEIERSHSSTTISSSRQWESGGARSTTMNDCLVREIYYE